MQAVQTPSLDEFLSIMEAVDIVFPLPGKTPALHAAKTQKVKLMALPYWAVDTSNFAEIQERYEMAMMLGDISPYTTLEEFLHPMIRIARNPRKDSVLLFYDDPRLRVFKDEFERIGVSPDRMYVALDGKVLPLTEILK